MLNLPPYCKACHTDGVRFLLDENTLIEPYATSGNLTVRYNRTLENINPHLSKISEGRTVFGGTDPGDTLRG